MVQTSWSVLIADDDLECRGALSELMEADGFHTILAANGSEAVEIVRASVVDLSILDNNMPGLTGLEAVRIIHEINIRIPIILISADNSKELQLEALEFGASATLSKPVHPALFRYTVKQIMNKLAS